MKTCPVCNSRCFDDMDTCYGCLYSFNSHDEEPKKPQKVESSKNENTQGAVKTYNPKETKNFTIDDSITNKHVPEYFELETFTYIEEDSKIKTAAHAKCNCQKNEDIVLKLKIPKSILEKYVV